MANRLDNKKIELRNKIIDNIIKYNLIENNDKVLIGLSGGPDSVFMTIMLCEIKNVLYDKGICFDLYAAHLNHKIREEAKQDEDLAKILCENLGISFYSKEVDVQNIAKKEKISTEDAGRKERYNFFEEITKKYGITKIATAHNLEDNAETVIMKFIRGSSSNGLKGIEYKSNNIIRPILNISKKEVLDYLNNENIIYALDKTNFENDYTRNKIRNLLINQLKEYNPNIVNSLNNMSNIFKDENKIIEDFKNEKIKDIINENIINIEKINKLKEYEKRVVILKIIEYYLQDKKDISYTHIDQILDLFENAKKNKKFEIKDRYCIQILNNKEAVFIKH